MSMITVWLLAIIIACGVLAPTNGQGETIFVTPNTTTPCPSPCYTMEQLYQLQEEGIFNITSNTTMFFLRGDHIIDSETVMGHFIVRDVDDISLLGPGARVVCNVSFGLAFVNITNLTIAGLEIANCGAEISMELANDALSDQTNSFYKIGKGLKAALFVVNIRSLMMTIMQIKNSSGYGLLGINLLANSTIQLSRFEANNILSKDIDHCWSQSIDTSEAIKCQGGNALILYADLPECPNSFPLFDFTVYQSFFSLGFDLVGGKYSDDYVSYGSGLGVILSQQNYRVAVRVVESVFKANVAALFGANMHFRASSFVRGSSVSIEGCQSIFGNNVSQLPKDKSTYSGIGAGLYFVHGVATMKNNSCENNFTKTREGVLIITNSTFAFNLAIVGAGMTISIRTGFQLGTKQQVTRTVSITNTSSTHNVGFGSVGMWAFDHSSPVFYEPVEMTIKNSHFLLNRNILNIDILSREEFSPSNTFYLLSILGIFYMRNVTFQHCTINGNINSPIYATGSYIYFRGNNSFIDNWSINGGALSLTSDSMVFLTKNTHITFSNNTALRKGGAIYVEAGSTEALDFNCPIQVYDPALHPMTQLDIKMQFMNNSAVQAGDALYGGHIDSCIVSTPSQFWYNEIKEGDVFDNITDFTGQAGSDSVISSDSIDVCFCVNDRDHNCDTRVQKVEKYPGETFQVLVVGVGQRGGTTPTIVSGIVANDNGTIRKEELKRTNRTCNNVTFTVASLRSGEKFTLTGDQSIQDKPAPIILAVSLRPCPTGFEIDSTTKICECALALKARNMTDCDINTGVIRRLPPYWLTNYSQHLVLHDHCPYDYCKTTPVEITMEESDINKQCAFNRTGTLCGECEDGLSMVFGTSRCLYCSNYYLALLVPFAAAGIVLVVLIFLLNLTVSVGAINGLIFYANVVKINDAVFFPPGDNSPLKVFISWVNLDLGIETCFYDGMDSYAKTWLQFAFPLYIWSILIFIIVTLRYSTKLTNICGKNTIFVLATIFLLSFTKILRTIITALSFTVLNYPDSKGTLWLYDGNVQYAKQRHIGLLTIAALFLLALVPYTLLIAIVQFLRRCSGNICLKWVSKFMPIFDAYLGPYKNKCGYWTGLLLVLRVVLALIFVLNIFGDPAINLLVIILVAIVLIVLNLGQGGVYKNSFITALEISFMLNLGALAAVTNYTRQTGGKQEPVIYTSTSIALFTLVVILGYHVYVHEKMKPYLNKCWTKIRRETTEEREELLSGVFKKEKQREPGYGATIEHNTNDEQDRVPVTVINGVPDSSPRMHVSPSSRKD